MTWEVTGVEGGSRVDITADDVPDGVSPEDHEAGLTSSLVNLARYVRSNSAQHSVTGSDNDTVL